MMTMRVVTFVVLSLFSRHAISAVLLTQVHEILNQAKTIGRGEIVFKHTGECTWHCGYPEVLPEKVWRDSYQRVGSYKWSLYYAWLSDNKKGELLRTQINYYESGDVKYVFWLDKNEEIVRFIKKIQNTTLVINKNTSNELVFSAELVYDKQGVLMKLSPSVLLVNDNEKDADYSVFDITSDGEIKNIESGKYEYYQLNR